MIYLICIDFYNIFRNIYFSKNSERDIIIVYKYQRNCDNSNIINIYNDMRSITEMYLIETETM